MKRMRVGSVKVQHGIIVGDSIRISAKPGQAVSTVVAQPDAARLLSQSSRVVCHSRLEAAQLAQGISTMAQGPCIVWTPLQYPTIPPRQVGKLMHMLRPLIICPAFAGQIFHAPVPLLPPAY